MQFWKPWQLRRPLGVVLCSKKEHVVAAVRWARALGVCLSVKSSGHSYSSTAVLDGTVLLDLGGLNQSTLNCGNILTVGPGARMRDVLALGKVRKKQSGKRN
jgi:FAD/FMN-containing dehydrogenase